MPKISIILPTYNGEKYIRESIESIIQQTMTDWELIVVNDCSNDNTADIVNSYAKKDSRIKLIHNQINQQLPKSLNIGFTHARGKYLTWTSDDNYYLPEALAVLSDTLDKNENVYLVYASMDNIDENGVVLFKTQACEQEELIVCSNMIGACFMYRREVLKTVGEYSEDLFLVEDYDYWLRIYEHYKKIMPISKTLYCYRRHDLSLTETKKQLIEDQLEKLKKKHIKKILEIIHGNQSLMYRVYYELYNHSFPKDYFNAIFNRYTDDFKFEIDGVKDVHEIMILGAGNLGRKALLQLEDKVLAFVDNDAQKIGTYLEELPIISLQEAIDKQNENVDITIMIAVSEQYIYELVKQLRKSQARKFCTFQYYCYYLEQRVE